VLQIHNATKLPKVERWKSGVEHHKAERWRIGAQCHKAERWKVGLSVIQFVKLGAESCEDKVERWRR